MTIREIKVSERLFATTSLGTAEVAIEMTAALTDEDKDKALLSAQVLRELIRVGCRDYLELAIRDAAAVTGPALRGLDVVGIGDIE